MFENLTNKLQNVFSKFAKNASITEDNIAEAIRELERANLLAALERADGKIYGAGGAAELLGMKPTTVASRIQRLGIKRPPSD